MDRLWYCGMCMIFFPVRSTKKKTKKTALNRVFNGVQIGVSTWHV